MGTQQTVKWNVYFFGIICSICSIVLNSVLNSTPTYFQNCNRRIVDSIPSLKLSCLLFNEWNIQDV